MHSSPSPLRPRLVLIVEDDPVLGLDTAAFLERSGYTGAHCSTGEDALAFAASRPDLSLVLMDISLRGALDGIATARELLTLRELPIVFVTAHTDSRTLEQVREVTRYGFVQKGSGELLLLSAVEMALELWDARQRTADRMQELQQSRERYRLIVENAPIGIVDYDTHGVIRHCNDAFVAIIGSSRSQLIGLDMTALPDSRLVAALDLALNGQTGFYEGEYHSVTAVKVTPVRIQFVPFFDEAGVVNGGLCLVADISREKQAVETHRRNAGRLAQINTCLLSLTDNYDDNINRITQLCGEIFDGVCALYNRLDRGLLCSVGRWNTPPGYNPVDRPDGHLCYDVIRLSRGDFLYQQDLLNSPYAQTDPNVRPYGLQTYAGHAVRYHGQPVGSLCVVFQEHVRFTDDDRQILGILALALGNEEGRHRSRVALQESERRLSTLMENLSGMAYRCRMDEEGSFEFVSNGCLQLTGWSSEELVADRMATFGTLCHPDDEQRVFAEIGSSVEAGESYILEYRIIDREGRVRWVWEKGRAVGTDTDGTVIIEGLVTEDTAMEVRRQSELRLAAQTERLNAIITALPDLLFIMDPDGKFVEYYAADNNLLAMPAEQVVGSNLAELFSEEETARHLAVYRRCLETGELQTIEYSLGLAEQRRYYEARITPVNEQLVLSIVRDITVTRESEAERTRLERQLQQTQRMDTIGTLAGGIAHDFNNILTPILGFSDLILQTLDPADQNYELVQRIGDGARQARNLIRQILSFNRRVEQHPQEVDLARLVEETAAFLRPTIPSTVSIRTVYHTEVQPVSADSTQLQQVIVNLCTNAYQALEANGTTGMITLDLDRSVLRERNRWHLPAGVYARLTVSDNGPGIPAAILDRIFEPFFTTKEVDKGTGLGLSVVHGIVKAHEGGIEAGNAPGGGAQFTLLLPVSQQTQRQLQSDERPVPAEHGTGTVWVVDDDPGVAAVVASMLEHAGYTAVRFNTTAAVLQACNGDGPPPDLLLTDLTMPGMTGVQLAAAVGQQQPGIPVIVMTGYGRRHESEIKASRNIRAVLGKPVEIHSLLETVHRVLAGQEDQP